MPAVHRPLTAQVRGAVLLALDQTLAHLGLAAAPPSPPTLRDQWTPLEELLRRLEHLRAAHGTPLLQAIGRHIPATALFPPEVRTLERALRTLDIAYHLNHREGDIGNYLYQKLDPHQGLLHCSAPYGCPFDQGILEGLADRFLPAGRPFQVTHQPSRTCRELGSEACVYLVSWSD